MPREALQDATSPVRRPPRGLLGFPRRHPRITAAAVLGILTIAVLGFLWFRPDKLFVNTTVDEAIPSAPEQGQSAAGKEPDLLSVGSFRDLEHETTGEARILALPDGKRVLRLADFRTSNGPDVVVILSDTPATEDDWGAYDEGRIVKIAPLKGNRGNQNYQIPAEVELSAYRSVVIWCRRFNVAFGAAPLDLSR